MVAPILLSSPSTVGCELLEMSGDAEWLNNPQSLTQKDICWYISAEKDHDLWRASVSVCRCSREDRGTVCHGEQSTCRAVEIENMEILLARAKTSLPTTPRDIKKELRGWTAFTRFIAIEMGTLSNIHMQPTKFLISREMAASLLIQPLGRQAVMLLSFWYSICSSLVGRSGNKISAQVI